MIFTSQIAHVDMSPSQKAKALEILGTGNLLMKKWAVYAEEFRPFRNAVLNGKKNPLGVIPADQLEQFAADLPAMTRVNKVKYEEFDWRTAEQMILESFSKMVVSFATKWYAPNQSQTRDDYIQEGYLVVLQAMYSWVPGKSDIQTYVYQSMQNEMGKVKSRENVITPNEKATRLKSKYEKACRVGSDKKRTFDEIVAELGFSEKEIGLLDSTMVQLPSQIQDGEDRWDDYTAGRAGIDSEFSREESGVAEAEHIENLFRKANLTQMEKDLILSFMNAKEAGWQTEYAASHTSGTGNPYTKQLINQYFKLARGKIKFVLECAKAA